MFSLRTVASRRGGTSFCKQCLKLSSRPLTTKTRAFKLQTSYPRFPTLKPLQSSLYSRTYATKSSADDLIEQIQDQYATARDEFEIATEETEKKTTYAEGDRKAAREELDKLKEMFEEAVKGVDGEEIQRRIGGRIRELDNAVQVLEHVASEHD
ncbi:hypothetical protein G7Y89_g1809 [Cudoniella acicularis]|uniref:Uncharacterized protein n=1 Tax=Cudoniella acicularis TaxID=354080 RepID=A0A8H4RWD7_9HELO|nr:hypothetical protein G7Y89_g1809 [Cudoniella acicularis]